MSIKATSPYRSPEHKDEAIWIFCAEYAMVIRELSRSLIYCFKSFSRSVELEFRTANEIRLNNNIETPSRCWFSLMRMIVRNGKRTELPRWPFTCQVNSLTASANDNVKVRMALPIARETVGIVNDVDLKSLRCNDSLPIDLL